MDILHAITCYLQLILYLVFSLTVHWHIWKSNWSIPLKNKQTHSNCCKTCKTHTFMLTLTDWYLCVWWGVSHGHQGREASRQQENQEDLSLAQTHRDSSGPHWEHVGVSSDKVTEPGIWLAERERWGERQRPSGEESFDVYPGLWMSMAGSELCDWLGWWAREWPDVGHIPGHSPGLYLHTGICDTYGYTLKHTHTQTHARLNKG